MINDFFGSCKNIFVKTVYNLKGPDRRAILAEIAEEYGYGGISLVARKFNVGRDTIRKGMRELKEKKPIQDANNKKGRKSTFHKLPNLRDDINEIAESQCQIDPKFQSERLYTKLTVKTIRKELIDLKGYEDEELPTNQTLNTILNNLGFNLKKIQKTKPKMKLDETDVIFDNLKKVHETIKYTDRVLRLSIDAKNKVKIGSFSRGGKNRVETKAYDHDFGDKYITPFGIMNLTNDTVDISMIESKLTADYTIKLNLAIENKKNPNEDTIVKIDVPLENEEATNVDKIEKIMLNINYEAIREAIAKHLENISKKNVNLSNQELEEQLKKIVKDIALMEK